jgi:hypothetical protein
MHHQLGDTLDQLEPEVVVGCRCLEDSRALRSANSLAAMLLRLGNLRRSRNYQDSYYCTCYASYHVMARLPLEFYNFAVFMFPAVIGESLQLNKGKAMEGRAPMHGGHFPHHRAMSQLLFGSGLSPI